MNMEDVQPLGMIRAASNVEFTSTPGIPKMRTWIQKDTNTCPMHGKKCESTTDSGPPRLQGKMGDTLSARLQGWDLGFQDTASAELASCQHI